MCGITGIFNLDNNSIDKDVLNSFTDSLVHRGPDGRGIFIDKNLKLGLGHRRLSILDLSEAGKQPMQFKGKRYTITYNGEIYNFLEIKEELKKKGYIFKTDTDTEVIMAAYDCWGENCQFKFNGMWAFAIWDQESQSIFISRDRFGIKPLFYSYKKGKYFIFASELKAFKTLPHFSYAYCEQGIRTVLTDPFSLEGTENTLIKNIKNLPGGHFLKFTKDSGILIKRWWKTFEHLVDVPTDLEEQVKEFKRLFEDSCRLRMRSDVPMTTALSGGIDSSSVVCTIAHIGRNSSEKRVHKEWKNAFIGSFPNSTYDEGKLATHTAKKAGFKTHYAEINSTDMRDNLQEILSSFESIYLTLPGSAWSIYKKISEKGFKISIDGHGVDEMLGGYPNYTLNAINDSLSLFGNTNRTRNLVKIYKSLHVNPYDLKLSFTKREILRSVVRRNLYLRFLLDKLLKVRDKIKLSPIKRKSINNLDNFIKKPNVLQTLETEEESEYLSGKGNLDKNLYRDFHFKILPTILRNFDRMSMAHGVEIRMPFMDWRLVCFIFSLPPESKIGDNFTKAILRKAMRGRVPDVILNNRKKIGLNAPMDEWFRDKFKPILESIILDADFLKSDIWNGPVVANYIDEKLQNDSFTFDNLTKVWPIIHAYWFQKNTTENYVFN